MRNKLAHNVRIVVLAALPLASSPAFCEEVVASNYSPRAKKIIRVMDAAGLNSAQMRQVVDYLDTNTHDGYIHFAEQPMMGGQLGIRYRLHGGVSTENAELHYTPTDSNMDYVASVEGLMANYHLEF